MFFYFEILNGYKLVIFQPLIKFDINEFKKFCQDRSNKYIPSEVIFLHSELQQEIEKNRIEESIKEKFNSNIKTCIAQYTCDGYIFNKNINTSDIIKYGIENICSRRNPIDKPPHGHVYTKPSGKASSDFIRISNLIVNICELYFLAFATVNLLGDKLDETLHVILIDTPDLIVLMQICFELKNFKENKPNLKVFSSYSKYRNTIKKYKDKKFIVVISASTSGDLAQKIKTRLKVDNENIFTILRRTKDGDDKNILYSLSKKEDSPYLNVDLPRIKINSEKFVAQQEQDVWVILSKVKNTPWRNKYNQSKEVFTSIEKSKAIQGIHKKYGLEISAENLCKSKEFKIWVKDTILWNMPLSTKIIIYTDEYIKNILPELNQSKQRFIKYNKNSFRDNLKNNEDRLENSSIMVISSVLSNGTSFLDISRTLRDFNSEKNINILNIFYLSGICVQQNTKNFTILKNNLEMSYGYKYLFHNYFTLNIGRIKNISCFEENIEDYSRNQITIDDSISSYKLSDGFSFFNTKCENTAFTVMGMVLQSARERRISDEYSLYPSSIKNIALDSENFFRFNDPLLQVSLLRFSEPHELDYTSSIDHSENIEYLILNSSENFPEVFREFLIALTIRKLTVHNGSVSGSVGSNVFNRINTKLQEKFKSDTARYKKSIKYYCTFRPEPWENDENTLCK